MTSYCDIRNGVYAVTMTTIRHCSMLEFGKGAYNQRSRPGHHQTSARRSDISFSAPKAFFKLGALLEGLWLDIDQYIRPGRYIGRYLRFTNILVSVKTADSIGLNRSWQSAVIFLTHPDNMRKNAQRSKSRQLSYNNAIRCGFINKQTRLTVERASAVTTETKTSTGAFAMLEATMCRGCVQINSHCISGSFRSTKSLTVT